MPLRSLLTIFLALSLILRGRKKYFAIFLNIKKGPAWNNFHFIFSSAHFRSFFSIKYCLQWIFNSPSSCTVWWWYTQFFFVLLMFFLFFFSFYYFLKRFIRHNNNDNSRTNVSMEASKSFFIYTRGICGNFYTRTRVLLFILHDFFLCVLFYHHMKHHLIKLIAAYHTHECEGLFFVAFSVQCYYYYVYTRERRKSASIINTIAVLLLWRNWVGLHLMKFILGSFFLLLFYYFFFG